MSKNAAKAYHMVGVQGGVEGADPYQLTAMLLNGALSRIAAAKGFLKRGDVEQRGETISKAISIIEGLSDSLDFDIGKEVATNLGALYDYMSRRLLEANINNDEAALDEVATLLREIKSAWDAIPVQQRSPQTDGA